MTAKDPSRQQEMMMLNFLDKAIVRISGQVVVSFGVFNQSKHALLYI